MNVTKKSPDGPELRQFEVWCISRKIGTFLVSLLTRAIKTQ